MQLAVCKQVCISVLEHCSNCISKELSHQCSAAPTPTSLVIICWLSRTSDRCEVDPQLPYAPIKVQPHYPPSGQMWGHLTTIEVKSCPWGAGTLKCQSMGVACQALIHMRTMAVYRSWLRLRLGFYLLSANGNSFTCQYYEYPAIVL